MSKIIKARVISGRYSNEIVRITNVSVDELGRKNAACFLSNGGRANIPVSDLELIPEEEKKEPEVRRAQTLSMPFISGASNSRTMTQTKNMAKLRGAVKPNSPVTKKTLALCETCGTEYNQEERRGQPGKLTQCEYCALETENKAEGTMIFSHKTGATIEIKKDGKLHHEADTFDPKNKI